MNPTGINPSSLPCFELCNSCFRCNNKNRYAKCQSCSGRHDAKCKRDPYDIDDHCRCGEGVLQFRTQKGKLLQQRFKVNPYGGKVKTTNKTEDENAWDEWLKTQRERLDDEHWDPIRFSDGKSTDKWARDYKDGN